MTAAALADDLAVALDPALLFTRMGLTADPWQARLLRSKGPRVLLNIHRQAGKSTGVGALAAHTAVYEPDSLILLLSPGLRQSQELFRKTLTAYHALDGVAPADAENKLTLELHNGSRIIALPGNEETIRGYSGVRLLLIDEAARVSDLLYYSVRPMLAVSGGWLIALSTFFGRRGWFHEAWESNQDWERYEVPATMCNRISAKFLAEERVSMGAARFAQEYMCKASETEGSVFDYDSIEALFDGSVRPMFPTLGLQGDAEDEEEEDE